jgi:hypothetical protein
LSMYASGPEIWREARLQPRSVIIVSFRKAVERPLGNPLATPWIVSKYASNAGPLVKH